MEVSKIRTPGINHCLNCVGTHPDRFPNINDLKNKLLNPQRDAWSNFAIMKEKLHLYKSKSCALCGRTYDKEGNVDETWELTAKRVKAEFDNAGIFGVPDNKIKEVVAQCRKSVLYLLKNRFKIDPREWEKFTFSGHLTLIITHAQIARKTKLSTSTSEDIKGMMNL